MCYSCLSSVFVILFSSWFLSSFFICVSTRTRLFIALHLNIESRSVLEFSVVREQCMAVAIQVTELSASRGSGKKNRLELLLRYEKFLR